MIDLASLLDLTFRIVVAIVLGAAIGLERQWRLRTAGIRTNALVSVGACLFVIVGAVGLVNGVGADPTRVAAQIVSGIGFLGAGVILRDGLNVRGLTTAATLWCAAAIGSLVGAGMEVLALVGSIAIIATNTLFRPVGRMVNRRTSRRISLLDAEKEEEEEEPPEVSNEYVLEVVTTEKSEPRVRALVLQAVHRPEYILRSLDVLPGKSTQMKVLVGIAARNADVADGLEDIVHWIVLDPKVTSSRWWNADID